MKNSLYPLKLYLKHIPNAVILGASLVLNIGIWIWLLLNIRPQQDPIFLHYNVLFGVDYTGLWYQVVYVPIVGISILVINGCLGWMLFQKDPFASSMLNAVSLLSNIFLAVTASLLVFLNV